MRVIVAGGGIVGLTAALALRSMGHDVVVCEQASGIRAVGAAIGLWRNALDALAAFGIGDRVEAIGTPIEAWMFDAAGRPHRTPGFDAAYYRFLLVCRFELNRPLAEAAGLDRILLDTKVVGFIEGDDAVAVRLLNGEVRKADLLVGADGVYSKVRDGLVPGFPAREHVGHHVWRGTVASGTESAAGSILTVGYRRSRGGFSRKYGGSTMWMVNQFDSPAPIGSRKEEAVSRARHLGDGGWNEALLGLIERTPEHEILHNQIMYVPELPHWSSHRVTLIGDAAHGLSPHIAAGGTLGIEDVQVLVRCLGKQNLADALHAYKSERMPHYRRVHAFAAAFERAADAQAYAREYAAFSHWTLNEGAALAREAVPIPHDQGMGPSQNRLVRAVDREWGGGAIEPVMR